MSNPTLKGRSAVVTGSVQGIGLSIATRLASHGCNILLGGFGDPAEIERTRADLAARFNVDVTYDGADLSRPSEIERMVADATARFTTIDIVVNNAAARGNAPVHEFKAAQWNHSLAVNLSAPFHLSRLTLGGMLSRGWGRIINISSGFGLIGVANRVDYVTTKTALLGLTRAIAVETAHTGVTCNALLPGGTFTPRQQARVHAIMAKENCSEEEATQRLARDFQVERFISPESVSAFAEFLCSDEAADVNGGAFPIDAAYTAGGMLRKPNWAIGSDR